MSPSQTAQTAYESSRSKLGEGQSRAGEEEDMGLFPTKILLATEGSEDAKLAAKTAIDLSTKLGSELHVIYVAPDHHYVHSYHDPRHEEEEEHSRREDRQALDQYGKYVREAVETMTEAHLRVR